ncbi:hypothetical protein KJ708_10365, partial [bacterium]|nr:hypothetical protein [bacterium]MBU1917162.1 hypothetical protein [bacterium]
MKLNLLLLAIVAVVRAMIPLYCIITKREITATDPWWQINVAKAIREQGHRIPRVLPRMKSHKVLGYPALYSWFLSFIPKSYMMRVALFTGTVFDIILFWLVLYITQWLKLYERVQIDEQHFYILTTIIFITTPFFNRMSLGKLVPRARPLGVLLGNISIAFAMMYVASWNIWHLFFAVVVFSLNTATSRFGVQGTIALIIGLGLLFKELYLVLFPFYAIPISVILTLGGNWGFLKGHFYHSVLYWKKLYKDMSLEKKHELYFPKKLT